MASLSKTTETDKNPHRKSSFIDPFPVCPVGKGFCKMPSCPYQIFTSFCDNCGKECHEDCGELLDVPHKFVGDEPGFYCLKCLQILPKTLYPRIPRNGITRHIPKVCDDGTLGFEVFMSKRKEMVAKSETKKKRARPSISYPTRASATRVMHRRR